MNPFKTLDEFNTTLANRVEIADGNLSKLSKKGSSPKKVKFFRSCLIVLDDFEQKGLLGDLFKVKVLNVAYDLMDILKEDESLFIDEFGWEWNRSKGGGRLFASISDSGEKNETLTKEWFLKALYDGI